MPGPAGAPERAAPGVLISKSGAEPDFVAGGNPPPNAGLPAELYADRAIIVLALRLEGYTYDQIAEKTNLSIDQIRRACAKARQAGKLRDVIDLIDNEAVPQAVDNLLNLLRNNDKEATFKVLEGRGAFRKFNNNKNEGGAVGATGLPPLQINIISATGGELPSVIVNSEKGSIIGTPYEDA